MSEEITLKTLGTRLDELLRLARQLGDLSESSEENEAADEKDATVLKKCIHDACDYLDATVPKLVLGWSGISVSGQLGALLNALLARIEMVVSYSYLYAHNALICCKASRVKLASATVDLLTSLKHLTLFLDTSPSDSQLSLECPKMVGAVERACKAIKLSIKNNRYAAAKLMLEVAMTVKDVRNEFTDISQNQREGREEEISPEILDGTGSGDLVEGSDEWYAMMDHLAEDDDLEVEELEALDKVLELVQMQETILLKIVKGVGSTKEWFQKADGLKLALEDVRKLGYVEWLNELTDSAKALGKAISQLGMSLYPPLDFSALEAGIQETKIIAGNLVKAYMTKSDKLDQQWVVQIERQIDNVASFSLS